jgi:hypothetical protein
MGTGAESQARVVGMPTPDRRVPGIRMLDALTRRNTKCCVISQIVHDSASRCAEALPAFIGTVYSLKAKPATLSCDASDPLP